ISIRRNKRKERGQMLSSPELRRLIEHLEAAPPRTRDASEAILLMLYTGCRSGEILRLTWNEVKEDHLALRTTKTGARTVQLNTLARAVLNRRHRVGSLVFPSRLDPSKPIHCVDGTWAVAKEHCRLPKTLRLHDLRHTFASHAILSGESLFMTGKLLGHRNPRSTERYAHLDGSTLREASEKIAAEIETMMGG
ncbi:MAG: site-specific integrase, partial [Pseudomonadota bacterium]